MRTLVFAVSTLCLYLVACSDASGDGGGGRDDGGVGATGAATGGSPATGAGGAATTGGGASGATGGVGGGVGSGLGAALCPAPVDVGHDVGQQLPSFEVRDCDGNAFSLDDLCGAEALWIFAAHGWCPLCQSVGKQAETLHDSFAGSGLVSVNVVVQDPDFGPPDAAYCKKWRDLNGLEDVITLFDPEGELLPLWSDSTSLSAFVSADRRIVSKLEHDSNIEHIAAGIEGALAE